MKKTVYFSFNVNKMTSCDGCQKCRNNQKQTTSFECIYILSVH